MRVLVVDDSILFRKFVRDALSELPGIEIVGSAADGRAALDKIKQLRPDAVTLDLEMPEVGGLEVLRQLHNSPHRPAVIVISALSEDGASLTAKALRLGAFDFVLKPNGSTLEENRRTLANDLLPKIEHLREQLHLTSALAPIPVACAVQRPSQLPQPPRQPPLLVAIGISTGGPSALHTMLLMLPGDLPVPVVVVQHMPPKFTRSLADDLNRGCALRVSEAEHGERLAAGHVYIVPGGLQTRIERRLQHLEFCVADDPPERCCKPSVDYLFRSLADELGARVLAVIMTGMGDDGVEGCRLLKRKGAAVLAQDASSCVVYGMPRQVIEHGLADMVRPLSAIAESIEHAVRPGALTC